MKSGDRLQIAVAKSECRPKCPACRSILAMRYPGNSPENGPAALRCPKGCQAAEPCEYCQDRWHDDHRATPGRKEKHTSEGHGLPEVDAADAEIERMIERIYGGHLEFHK